MPRKRTSPIWTVPLDKLKAAYDVAVTASELLLSLGLRNAGANFSRLKKRLLADGLVWKFNGARRPGVGRRTRLEDVAIEHSTYSRGSLKRRLIADGIFKNECHECGKQPEWRGKPLVMVLDHKNGIHNDNRLENLWLLCPDCNSQQATFAGRNPSRGNLLHRTPGSRTVSEDIKVPCNECGKPRIATNKYGLCKSCWQKTGARGPDYRSLALRPGWPSDEDLVELLCKDNVLTVATHLGVSYTGLLKFLNRRRLTEKVNALTGGRKHINPRLPTKPYIFPPDDEIISRLKTTSKVQLAKDLGIPEGSLKKHIYKLGLHKRDINLGV